MDRLRITRANLFGHRRERVVRGVAHRGPRLRGLCCGQRCLDCREVLGDRDLQVVRELAQAGRRWLRRGQFVFELNQAESRELGLGGLVAGWSVGRMGTDARRALAQNLFAALATGKPRPEEERDGDMEGPVHEREG